MSTTQQELVKLEPLASEMETLKRLLAASGAPPLFHPEILKHVQGIVEKAALLGQRASI